MSLKSFTVFSLRKKERAEVILHEGLKEMNSFSVSGEVTPHCSFCEFTCGLLSYKTFIVGQAQRTVVYRHFSLVKFDFNIQII